MKGRRGGRRGKEGEVARGCCLGFSKGEGEGAAASSLPCRRLSWWATTRKDETGFILQKADLGICILFLSSCKKARLLFFLPLEKKEEKKREKKSSSPFIACCQSAGVIRCTSSLRPPANAAFSNIHFYWNQRKRTALA